MQWAVVGCCIAALFALSAAKAVLDEEVGDHFVCPYPDGKFPDPKHCDKFYVCVGGAWTHEKCGDGENYNPWTQDCGFSWVDMICKVFIHPENHHIRHTYYISACQGDPKPFCTAPQANDTCHAVGLEPVAIKNWDEDTFLKDYTREFEVLWSENAPHDYPQPPFTYWTCGWRTEQSSVFHRDFRWWVDNSYMGYTDWCDAGLLKKDGDEAPMFPDSCRPDSLGHGCVHLNTSYIESYGWWDAADCHTHNKNFAICEHNHNEGTTTHGPTPTGPTPTPTPTPTPSPTPPTRPTTAPFNEGEFLHFVCEHNATFHGFCEYFVYCEFDGSLMILTKKYCSEEAGPGTMYLQKPDSGEMGECVDPAEYPELAKNCEKPPSPDKCYDDDVDGIYPNRRNCGGFYTCLNGDAKHYQCPEGWLWDKNQHGEHGEGNCVPSVENDPQALCPFDYVLKSIDEPMESTQCTSITQGRIAYEDPDDDPDFPADDDFILCIEKDGDIGQSLTSYYCPKPSLYNGDTGKCEVV